MCSIFGPGVSGFRVINKEGGGGGGWLQGLFPGHRKQKKKNRSE